MSEIEKALFVDGTVHYITSFALLAEEIMLTVCPGRGIRDADTQVALTRGRFLQVNPNRVFCEVFDAKDGIGLPWDIIGFDSDPLDDGYWRFCLHTDCVEYLFESKWPEITRVNGRRESFAIE